MSPRPRHTIKEIEKLLRSLESQGWRVEKGRKYFKAYCPCGLHKRTVHLTPSTAATCAIWWDGWDGKRAGRRVDHEQLLRRAALLRARR